jgi:predicted NBD/HSP70 family sugar kinase/DNA-binding XRE family transcriptional regulator
MTSMSIAVENRTKAPPPRFSFTNKVSASNKTPRQINRNLIFNQIRTKQPISRADLARVSGLQRSTISLIVEELLAERWIVEGSMGRLPRGRRPTFLNVNSQRGVLALDIHPAQTTLAIADLGGKILAQNVIELPENPQKVIGVIVAAIRKMIAANKDRAFDGIGMSVPGRLGLHAGQANTGKAVFAPNISWPIGRIMSRVEQATGLPVFVDNVANACALSEVWFGDSDGMHDLVVVNVSEGLGTGIFANGRILRGEGGSAGEFGHVQVDPNGLACGCGSRGCWETVASNRAGLRYYAEIAGKPSPAFEDLLKLAEGGDGIALKALDRMCTALGRGMHMIASALAPAEIVVVGDITTIWNLAGPRIEEEMRRNPMVRAPRLRPAQDGNKARLRSAVALVMHENQL